MDQRREPTRRRFASRRGLEGQLVDRAGVGGSGETSNMRSVTVPAPEHMRALANLPTSNLALYEAEIRATLRAAADQLEEMQDVLALAVGKLKRAGYHSSAGQLEHLLRGNSND